jgi:hypothetical protein
VHQVDELLSLAVCAVLEDPAGGYGAACRSRADVAAGKGWTALGPGPGSNSTPSPSPYWLVPAHQAAPSIKRADGATTPLRVAGGIAAAVVSARARGTTCG